MSDKPFYELHRPGTLDAFVGNRETIKLLENKLKTKTIPHAILFHGPPGCGKTSLGRALRTALGCGDADYEESDCATWKNPTETVKTIKRKMWLRPASGSCRIWVLEEVQSLSRAKFAQQGLLKILEGFPEHAYFFLTTTDPTKVIRPVQTRCTQIAVEAIKPKDMTALLERVLKTQKTEVAEEVVDCIVEVADGSGREALVLLEAVLGLDDSDDQLTFLRQKQAKQPAIQLCRMMLNPKTRWQEVAAFLKETDVEPEQLRRQVLGYTTQVLLKSGQPRVAAILEAFRDPYFDTGKSGLVLSCWEIFGQWAG